MKIVCISDTHCARPPLPAGDLLIHAGDLTISGHPIEFEQAAEWIASQPHKTKVVIAGNHDFVLQEAPFARYTFKEQLGVHYLQDQLLKLSNLRIWGSPWSLRFGDWAFGKSEQELEELYSAVPACDILITHGPPFGILDQGYRGGGAFRPNLGSHALLAAVERLQPKLHVFGHIHEAAGVLKTEKTIFVNASYPRNDASVENLAVEIDL